MPRMVVEEAKGAKVVVGEEARVVAPAQPKFLTPSQPREPRGTNKGVETKRPHVLKRGSSAGRIAEMEPGEERDGKVVRMEDDGQLATGNWQGSIIAVHRLSEVRPGRMVVTLDGKEWSLPAVLDGLPTVETLD